MDPRFLYKPRNGKTVLTLSDMARQLGKLGGCVASSLGPTGLRSVRGLVDLAVKTEEFQARVKLLGGDPDECLELAVRYQQTGGTEGRSFEAVEDDLRNGRNPVATEAAVRAAMGRPL